MKAAADFAERPDAGNVGASPYGVPYLPGISELPGVSRFPHLDLNSVASYGRVAGALDSPAQLAFFERLFLYGLVVALRPQRTLEIGFRYGGSAYLIMCALEDVGLKGRLVSLDPTPEPAVDFSAFADRFRLLAAGSPAGLEAATQELAGPIQLCFIDGDHTEQAVFKDLASVLPCMSDDSYIVLHDACNAAVRGAITRFVHEQPDIIDCGLMAREVNEAGWGGLHLLRVTARRHRSFRGPRGLWRQLRRRIGR